METFTDVNNAFNNIQGKINEDTEHISKQRLKHEIAEMLYGDGEKKELTFKVSKHEFIQALEEVVASGRVFQAPKVDKHPINPIKNLSIELKTENFK